MDSHSLAQAEEDVPQLDGQLPPLTFMLRHHMRETNPLTTTFNSDYSSPSDLTFQHFPFTSHRKLGQTDFALAQQQWVKNYSRVHLQPQRQPLLHS